MSFRGAEAWLSTKKCWSEWEAESLVSKRSEGRLMYIKRG